MKSVVLPIAPRGHKHCPDCHGWGGIIQDLAVARQIPRPCSECSQSGYVPISNRYWEPDPRPSAVLREYLLRTPFFTEGGNYRYCELCGDFAEAGDRRKNGLIVHAGRVCTLFSPRTLAHQAVIGDVVATMRLMNHHAPVLVVSEMEAPLNGCPGWISRTFRSGRWVRTGPSVRLVFDGPVTSRDMPAEDLMPRAEPAILREHGFAPTMVPEEWLTQLA